MNIFSKVCVCDCYWYFVQSRAGLVQHLWLWLWFLNVSVFFIVSLLSRGLVWFNISQDNAGGWRNEEITNAIKVSNNHAILIPLWCLRRLSWRSPISYHCGTLMKLNISSSPCQSGHQPGGADQQAGGAVQGCGGGDALSLCFPRFVMRTSDYHNHHYHDLIPPHFFIVFSQIVLFAPATLQVFPSAMRIVSLWDSRLDFQF